MTLKEQILQRLNNEGIFNPIETNNIIEQLTTVTSDVSYEYRLQVAITYLTHYAAQFRIPILTPEGDKLPMSIISWGFAPSGIGKDRMKHRIQKIFQPSLEKIKLSVIDELKQALAEKKSKDPLKSLVSDNPAFIPDITFEISFGTPEGFNKHLELVNKLSKGSILIFYNEMGTKINDSNTLEILSEIAQLYDRGDKLAKRIKQAEGQFKDLHSTPISALFVSSFEPIASNEKTQNNLMTLFKTQFSRRSNLTLMLESPHTKEEDMNLDEFLEKQRGMDQDTLNKVMQFQSQFSSLTSKLLEWTNLLTYITLDKEAQDLLNLYQRYNQYKTLDILDDVHQVQKYNMSHKHFQALKLSGVFALITCHPEVSKKHMLIAIKCIEILTKDYDRFKIELNKQPYEILYDFLKHNIKDKDELEIPATLLPKMKLISNKLSYTPELTNIIQRVNDIAVDGYVELQKNKIVFKKVTPLVKHTLSVTKCPNVSKEQRGILSAKFKEVKEFTFKDISKVVSYDTIFSQYVYMNNHKCKENLINKTSLIVIDVDQSKLTIEEMHSSLYDVNHIISTTSNKEDKYRYRIIFELDSYLSIEPEKFRFVIEFIKDNYLIGTPIDNKTIVQAFYGYKDSIVYITETAKKISVKELIEYCNTNYIPKKPLTPKMKKELLNDLYSTFEREFNHGDTGNRNNSLIRVINKCAIDLEASKEYCYTAVQEINNFWETPLTEEELKKHIYPHIEKKYK